MWIVIKNFLFLKNNYRITLQKPPFHGGVFFLGGFFYLFFPRRPKNARGGFGAEPVG